MAKQIDFLPFATGAGATVDSQATYAGSSYQVNGMQNGLALPNEFNKVWRQSSVVAAALATFISDTLNIDVLDDGNLAALVTELKNAIRAGGNKILVVPYAAAPVLDASQSSKFETTLAGPMAPTLINVSPGQRIVLIIHQDAVGGRVFTPPSNLPMADIDPGVNATSTQSFEVTSAGNLIPATPLNVS
jgi:hypothetical protein